MVKARPPHAAQRRPWFPAARSRGGEEAGGQPRGGRRKRDRRGMEPYLL
jgi:hypothetical protein